MVTTTEKNSKVITAIVIGAGSRGNSYADYALNHPYDLKILAVAEPDPRRRELFRNKFALGEDRVFSGWEEILRREKFADLALICTQDSMHREPAVAAMERGYDLLLEKPIAPDGESCDIIYEASRRRGVSVAVAHVLRYNRFFTRLRELLDGGEIGRVRGIQHNENIGHIHYSHSYVRGNWRREDLSSPILLAKSCHDMDILLYLTGAEKAAINSFGSRGAFTRDRKPEGTPERCLDGCPLQGECPYYAPRIYMTGSYSWPVDVVTCEKSREAVEKALREGPYGRCVYSCDNDVLEHQTVQILLDDRLPVVFTMSAFTESTSRTIKIMGERGQINGCMEKNEIEIHDFRTGEIGTLTQRGENGAHGGGDREIMAELIAHLRDKSRPLKSSIENSLLSHRMVFAAEKARREGCTVTVEG